jgi:hypothetical protein
MLSKNNVPRDSTANSRTPREERPYALPSGAWSGSGFDGFAVRDAGGLDPELGWALDPRSSSANARTKSVSAEFSKFEAI